MVHDPLEFGLQLIDSLDLDPVYVALYHAELKPRQLERLCVAYWCYYHLGAAAYASQYTNAEYWQVMRDGVSDFPRGTERRHFRGERARNSLREIEARFIRPESLVAFLCLPPKPHGHASGAQGKPATLREGESYPETPPMQPGALKLQRLTYGYVRDRVLSLPQFGPWIAFKIADMIERVLQIPVDFNDCPLLALYEEPRAGAERAAKAWKVPSAQNALDALVAQLRVKNQRWAPPADDRLCNIQEAETVLCKWKSHLNGHYEVGKDTHEVEHGLKSFPSITGNILLEALQKHSPILKRRLV